MVINGGETALPYQSVVIFGRDELLSLIKIIGKPMVLEILKK